MISLNSDPTARIGSASASASTPAPFHPPLRAKASTSQAGESDCLEGVRRYQWRSKRHFSDDLLRRRDAVRRVGCPEDVRERWTQVERFAEGHLSYSEHEWTLGVVCATAACLSGSMSQGFETLRQLDAPWPELLHALAGRVGDGRTWRLSQDCDRELAGTVRALLQAVALESRPQDHPLLRVLLAAFKVGRGAGAVEAADVLAWTTGGRTTFLFPRPLRTAGPFTWTPAPPSRFRRLGRRCTLRQHSRTITSSSCAKSNSAGAASAPICCRRSRTRCSACKSLLRSWPRQPRQRRRRSQLRRRDHRLRRRHLGARRGPRRTTPHYETTKHGSRTLSHRNSPNAASSSPLGRTASAPWTRPLPRRQW